MNIILQNFENKTDICLSAGEVGFSSCLLEQQFRTVCLPEQRTAAGKLLYIIILTVSQQRRIPKHLGVKVLLSYQTTS